MLNRRSGLQAAVAALVSGGVLFAMQAAEPAAAPNAPAPKEAVAPVTHAFLATGNATYIQDGAGKVTWKYDHASRDGWVLSSGNVLLALNKSKTYPGGAVAEIDPQGKIVFEWKGTQSEVNTVELLENGNFLVTEAGNKPRILEIDRAGKTVVDVAIQAQTKDHHLQTRMTRKLKNGNYLVPQLLDKVVREYTPEGKIVWEAKTPNMPFTAIRLDDGNTIVGCTHGNLVVELDPDGKIVWQLTNDDLANKPLSDCCGVQRLPNGDTVVTSYHAGAGKVKLTEVKRDKSVVWSYVDQRPHGIHTFQILDTNGSPIEGRPLR